VSPVQPDHSQSLQLILITVWQQDGEKKKSDRRARDKRRRCRKQQQTVCVFTPFGQQMRCEAAEPRDINLTCLAATLCAV